MLAKLHKVRTQYDKNKYHTYKVNVHRYLYAVEIARLS